ncbi:phenylacetate-CoA ligase [Methanocella conradii HZ254]|uniref:Phenylacetate-CoA ligase n=2 Tax=Methanocella TaxID=570266 RepID=H8I7T7_METCZ|nr:phenylacetate--CoA ligase [Methanocella conradii]AFC99922.1 phenylacetate-CoA ligase [Methanocella conradii HZ254]MDI6897269.1 phenylacetate--CoA ligase [Methanocella conradii]
MPMLDYWNSRIERAPLDELREIQARKLRQLVDTVYRSSQFYRKRFKEAGVKPEDIKTLDDVTKLPFTFKKDLRDNYPTNMFCVPLNQVVRFHVSSGTTGKPTVVGYTRGDIDCWTTSLARALTACGLGRGDVIQVSYGYGLFTGGLGLHYGAEEIGASVIPMGVGNTERQIELMQDLHATAIACTPSYLLHMNEVAKKMGISIKDETDLKVAILGAEPWSLETRKRIEDTMGIKAYDIYGTSELSGPLFTECKEQNGIHVWADHFLLEVVDKNGDPVKEGQRGELAVTTLSKEALPLIRYRVGDITILNNEECECGRTHPRIMRILGRADDMLIIRGINVFPSQIESVLMTIPEVGEHFQIIADRSGELDELTVRVEVTKAAFSDKLADLMKLEKKIEYELHKVLNLSTKVELVETGTLPRSQGKSQKVIDKRKI